MSLASAVMGALRPIQTITWLQDDETPLNLTDAELSGVIRNRTNGAARVIEGALTVTDAANGIFTWTYAEDDVAQPGSFEVQFTAVYASGTSPARTVRAHWYIEPALVVEVEE